MKSQTLNQNEVDLLFGGAPSVPVAPPTGAGQDVQVYDFRRPARISKDRNRSLTAMYGLLVKSIESWVTGRVREQLEVGLLSVEQITFGEFVLALPSPCASYVVDVPGSGRQGVIDFGHEFAYYLVDRLLGGVGRHAVPARSLSELERGIVQIAADRVASLLSDVWKDYVKLNLEVTGFESIPEMLRVANREDPVLVANLEVSAGDMSSLLMLCLPFSTVEKFFTGAAARRPQEPQGSAEERRADRAKLETIVRRSKVSLRARFPAFQVPLRELGRLRPGSLLATGLDPRSDLELLVADQRRFRASAGRMGRFMAARVIERARPEPQDNIAPGREEPPTL